MKYSTDEDLFEKFAKYAKITGIVFIVLGLIGIINPVVMTLGTVTLVAWLMLFAGLIVGYFTWLSNKHNVKAWLKSLILVGASLYILYYPAIGAATLGLLLSIYFFMNGFTGLFLAFSIRPQKGWIFWMISAILSLLIGVLFVMGWPFSSTYIVGLLVGFSLLFDGIALLVGGLLFSDMLE